MPIHYSSVKASGHELVQSYDHANYGAGIWILDEDTLQPIGEKPPKSPTDAALDRVESPFPGMHVRWLDSKIYGTPTESGIRRYRLRWETLDPNRDQPRQLPLPDPSMLRLYCIAK